MSIVLPKPEALLSSYARSSLLASLEKTITRGHLTVADSSGVYHCGVRTKGCNEVYLKVNNLDFWSRVLFSQDLGFSEAYMVGDVEVNSLEAVMNLWLENESGMDNLSSTIGRVTSAIPGLSNAFLRQTRSRARLNAIARCDQSNELFKAFLSKEMMCSCALWSDAEGGVRGDLVDGPFPGDLEAAQLRKIRHVLTKAKVKPGDRILEVGSGWGELAIEAARTFGCEVDTLTLAKEQKVLAEERIKAAGLQDRIRVHLMDYREIPADFEKVFDAFISVEMLEHVGSKNYHTYFKLVDFVLKSRNATVVVSASTSPESRYSSHQPENFMRRYMWPNSCLPSATALIDAANTGSEGRLSLEGVENHATHYPRTLREWGRRLEANVRQDLFIKDYPALKDLHEYETFKRKWQYLFAYAGAGFAKGYITCHMLTFTRVVSSAQIKERHAVQSEELCSTYDGLQSSAVLIAEKDRTIATLTAEVARLKGPNDEKANLMASIPRDLQPFVQYGVACSLPVDLNDGEHMQRKEKWEVDSTGERYVPGYFEPKLSVSPDTQEEMEFRDAFSLVRSSPADFGVQTVQILCYRGGLSNPKWLDEDESSFSVLCVIHADLGKAVKDLDMKKDESGDVYYQLDYDVIVSFGSTDLRAELCWTSRRGEQRIPAMIL